MIKVLIVEDEELIRKGLIYTIDWMAMGCIIVGEAKDGEEGLVQIEKLKPDVVITDIRMPKMTGIEMIAEAQNRNQEDFVPVILTSYSDFEYARTSIRLGVFEYLLKPVSDEALKEVMERVERKHQQEIQAQQPEHQKISWALQESSFKNPYVIRAIEEIKKNYQHKITLQMVADKLNISVTYLNKKLKEETSATFLDLLNRYRVTKAGELLQTGEYRIYEVSEMTGFSDYKHFCAVFKKYTGMIPTSFTK